MSIQVSIKNVYGNETIYPMCEKSKAFARMLGQKTLTFSDIQHIKEIGFEVQIVQPEIKI